MAKGWTTDRRWRDKLPDPDTFDPTKKYTATQLEGFATALLMKQRREEGGSCHQEENKWLDPDALYNRHRREIITTNGVVNEYVKPGLFWRSSPEGRALNPDRIKDGGGAFYREGGADAKAEENERLSHIDPVPE